MLDGLLLHNRLWATLLTDRSDLLRPGAISWAAEHVHRGGFGSILPPVLFIILLSLLKLHYFRTNNYQNLKEMWWSNNVWLNGWWMIWDNYLYFLQVKMLTIFFYQIYLQINYCEKLFLFVLKSFMIGILNSSTFINCILTLLSLNINWINFSFLYTMQGV